MGWVRIDDAFYDHAKFDVGPIGEALWLRGLAWSNRNLTDGFIPSHKLSTLIDVGGVGEATPEFNERGAVRLDCVAVDVFMLADRLVKAGLWHAVPDGYEIHDYARYQKTADQIRSERERERKRWERRSGRGSPPGSGGSPPSLRVDSAAESERSAPATQPQPQKHNSRGESSSLVEKQFNAIWEKYPNKKARKVALTGFRARIREGVSIEQLERAVVNYAAEVRGKNLGFVMHGGTFFGPNERWVDYLERSPTSGDESDDDPEHWFDVPARNGNRP